MRSYESNEDAAGIIVYLHNEAKFVTFYIEYDAIVRDDARVGIGVLDIARRVPIGGLSVLVPRAQILLRSRMGEPKIAQRAEGENSHVFIIPTRTLARRLTAPPRQPNAR